MLAICYLFVGGYEPTSKSNNKAGRENCQYELDLIESGRQDSNLRPSDPKELGVILR